MDAYMATGLTVFLFYFASFHFFPFYWHVKNTSANGLNVKNTPALFFLHMYK
jgi:hypothetical protein